MKTSDVFMGILGDFWIWYAYLALLLGSFDAFNVYFSTSTPNHDFPEDTTVLFNKELLDLHDNYNATTGE